MKSIILFEGKPNKTYRIASTDVAQGFTSTHYTLEGKPAIGALITCEDNDIRFTLGDSTPTQGASGLGHILYKGQSYQLVSSYAIRTFKFLNHTNSANAAIQVTFGFELGG